MYNECEDSLGYNMKSFISNKRRGGGSKRGKEGRRNREEGREEGRNRGEGGRKGMDRRLPT